MGPHDGGYCRGPGCSRCVHGSQERPSQGDTHMNSRPVADLKFLIEHAHDQVAAIPQSMSIVYRLSEVGHDCACCRNSCAAMFAYDSSIANPARMRILSFHCRPSKSICDICRISAMSWTSRLQLWAALFSQWQHTLRGIAGQHPRTECHTQQSEVEAFHT